MGRFIVGVGTLQAPKIVSQSCFQITFLVFAKDIFEWSMNFRFCSENADEKRIFNRREKDI